VCEKCGLGLQGCTNVFGALRDDDRANDPGDGVTGRNIDSFVTDFAAELSASDLISLQESAIGSIAGGARSQVGEENLQSRNFEEFIPTVVEGAQASLAGTGLTDEEKIMAIRAIVSSAMGTIGGYKTDFDDDFSVSAVDPKLGAMLRIIERLSASSVRSLRSAGISDASIGDAASEAVSGIVESTERAGVRRDNLSESVQRVTKAAVEVVRDVTAESGGDQSEAKRQVVSSITEGATAGAIAVASATGDRETGDQMVEKVSEGATSGLRAISDDEEETKSLIGGVTRGFADGVNRSADKVTADDVQRLVQRASAGSTRAIRDITNDANDDTEIGDLLETVSRESSRSAATIDGTRIAGIDRSQLAENVVRGTAEGAQEIRDGGVSETVLTARIRVVTVDESGNETERSGADFTTAVTEGRDKGLNEEPVANAGSDRVATVGTEVNLDGSGSSDTEDGASGTPLVFRWSVATAPTLSGATITSPNSAQTTFIPDVAGEYTINLRVTDSDGAIDNDSFALTAESAERNETYNGLTIDERMDRVRALNQRYEHRAARDELQVILNNYPNQGEQYRRAMIELGHVYRNMGEPSRAHEAYLNLMGMFPDSEEAGSAKVDIAGLHMFHYQTQDLVAAQTLIDEVQSAYAGTTPAIHADLAEAAIHVMKNEESQARTILEPHRTNQSIPVHMRYWAQSTYAWSYESEDNLTSALTAREAAINDTRFWTNSEGGVERDLLEAAYSDALDLVRYRMNDYPGAITLCEAARTDTNLPDYDRIWYGIMKSHIQGWDQQDFLSAIATLQSVRADFSTTTETKPAIGATHLFEGHFHRRLFWDFNGGQTAINAALAAYNTITDDSGYRALQGGWFYYEAVINKAEITNWDLEPRDPDEAIGILTSMVSGFPEDAERRHLAHAYLRLGQFYHDLGRDKDDWEGYDWQADLYTAMGYLDRVSRATFPDLYDSGDEEWIFREALERKARINSDLGNYSIARSYFTAALSDPETEVEDKAWLQRELARTYIDEFDEYNRRGMTQGAVNVYDLVVPVLEAVESYTYPDGKAGEAVDEGRPWAEALHELVWMSRETGESYRWDLNNGTEAEEAWTAGDAFFTRFESDFPDYGLSMDEWLYVETLEEEMEILTRLGEVTGTTTYFDRADALASRLSDTASSLSEEWQVRASRELGEYYRQRGYTAWDMEQAAGGTPSEIPAQFFLDAISAYDAGLTGAGTNPDNWPDQGTVAEMYAERGDIYRELFRYYSDFDETTAQDYADQGITALNTAISILGAEGVDIEGQRYLARARHNLGHLYAGLAHAIWQQPSRTAADRTDQASYFTQAEESFNEVIVGFENGTYPGIESDDLVWAHNERARALYHLFEVRSEQFREDDIDSTRPTADVLKTAYDTVLKALAYDARAAENAWALVEAGRTVDIAYRWVAWEMNYLYENETDNSRYFQDTVEFIAAVQDIDASTDPVYLEVIESSVTEIHLYLEQVRSNYSDVDGGRAWAWATHLQTQFNWLLAAFVDFAEQDAPDNTSRYSGDTGATFADAKAEVLAGYDALLARQADLENLGESWMIDEASRRVGTDAATGERYLLTDQGEPMIGP
jgi:tetratricopeptide (TPR) repeat protein